MLNTSQTTKKQTPFLHQNLPQHSQHIQNDVENIGPGLLLFPSSSLGGEHCDEFALI